MIFLRLYFLLSFFLIDSLEFNQISDCVLSKYKRPFSLLYINPADEQSIYDFSLQYPSSFCVILEADPSIRQKHIVFCKKHSLKNIVILEVPPTNVFLSLLNDVEVFDVVLLDRKERVAEIYWKESFQSLTQFVIVPKNNGYILSRNILKCVKNQPEFDTFKVYEFENSEKRFKHNNCLYPKKGEHILYSDFERQRLYKIREKKYVDWTPGINFVTYKLFLGGYPQSPDLYEKIKKLDWETHDDPQVINLIITGDNLRWIDNEYEDVHKRMSLAYRNKLRQNTKHHFDLILKIANEEPFEFLNNYYIISNGANCLPSRHRFYEMTKEHFLLKFLELNDEL